MISRFSPVLVCALALAANPTSQQKSDQDKIQGTWKLESGMLDGKALPADEIAKEDPTMVFDGNKVKISKKVDGKANSIEMTFKLDPTKNPKAIDLENAATKGKPLLGIYSLEGDTLRVCHGKDGELRPTEFASKEGARMVLVVFKRAK